MMEAANVFPSLARLITILQEQSESFPGTFKYVSGNVKNLKLGVHHARGLLLKEGVILQVDKFWDHHVSVLTKLCYDAEDIVNQMEYEISMMSKTTGNLKALLVSSSSIKVQRIFLIKFLMQNMLKDRQKQLKAIIRELHFNVELIRIQIPSPMKLYRRFSPHPDQNVPLVGRNAYIKVILDTFEKRDSLGVSIVGMHGVGKSALAIHIMQDTYITARIEMVLWASLSGPFNQQEIREQLIQQGSWRMGRKKNDDISLNEILGGKRWLIVFDNLSDVMSTEWLAFTSSLPDLSMGKFLITTVNHDVARVTQTRKYYLNSLSKEDSGEVILRRAGSLPIDDVNLSASDIETLANKCHGLPIIANFIGSLLRDEDERKTLLKTDLWDVPEFRREILPALMPTYSMLEPHLKKCFAYFSLFPDGYQFNMEDLVQLWIAEGFIDWPDKSSLEEVCKEYLRIFVRCSILQPSDDLIGFYKIHQFTHNLAKLVSSNTCICFDGKHSGALNINTRHLSLPIQSPRQHGNWDEIQYCLKLTNLRLRTFLPLNGTSMCFLGERSIPRSFFKTVSHLRVLSLNQTGIYEIPDTIKMLKFLRYLDVSGTYLKALPEAVCKLSYIQILKLTNCQHLKRFPQNFKNLTNLRYIDWKVPDMSRLISMPPSIGSLTGLQRLPLFQVGAEKGFGIVELKNMVHLRGSICIKNLQDVKDQKEAEAAKLSTKMFLETLELEWSLNSNAQNTVDILTALQPHKDLKHLRITNYVGPNFPQWLSQLQKLHSLTVVNCPNLTSLPSFLYQTSMVNLEINNCKKISLLPKLPLSLKSLTINKCDLIKDNCKVGATYWSILKNVPNVLIDDQHLTTLGYPINQIQARDTVEGCMSTDTDMDMDTKVGAGYIIRKIEDTVGKFWMDKSQERSGKKPLNDQLTAEVNKESLSPTIKKGDSHNKTKQKEVKEEPFLPMGRPEDARDKTVKMELVTKNKVSAEVNEEESLFSSVGKTDDTCRETAREKVSNLFRDKLEERNKLTDIDIKYYLEAQDDMRLFCIIFSHDYDFEEETLLQFWVTSGFLKSKDKNYIGRPYFDILLSTGYIFRTGTSLTSKMDKFRANVDMIRDDLASFTPMSLNDELAMHSSRANYDLAMSMLNKPAPAAYQSKNVLYHKTLKGDLHMSLMGDEIDERSHEALRKNFDNLKALFLYKNAIGSMNKIPQYVFSALNLEILHLGGTGITNLPSSIGNLLELRYLDLSFTLIEVLPDNVQCLSKLQTLKLNNCERLLRLPGEMRKLTSLQHLELDIHSQLAVMPRGMGALTGLETLSAFLVQDYDGRSITELKNMNKLKGSFCISRLENVLSPNEAEEASLINKKFLEKLELRWSNSKEKRRGHHYEILHLLRPYSGLEQLCISCYGGKSFPNWISNPSFYMLTGITLFKCDNAELLPSLGQLPYLKLLRLIEMNGVKEINKKFRGSTDNKSIAFRNLEILEFIGFSQLETWDGVKEGDYERLNKIIIERCPKLNSFPSSILQLHTLQHLEILQCGALTLLLDKKLSTSLVTLIVEDCPLITKQQFKKRKAKLKHVQNVWINHNEIIVN